MRRDFVLAAAIAVALAVPAGAQSYSEAYSFLEGVRDRDADTVQSIIMRPGSTAINTRDPSTGDGALHILVRGRDLTWLGFLLGRGARPDIATNDGTTPLILAAQIGWRDGAEQLLARGADPNVGNRDGLTPLMFAVQRRDLPMVRLLLSQGADPDQTDHVSGYSAIDHARQDRRAAAILREMEAAEQRAR